MPWDQKTETADLWPGLNVKRRPQAPVFEHCPPEAVLFWNAAGPLSGGAALEEVCHLGGLEVWCSLALSPV